MCDPVSAVLIGASTAVSAYGQYKAGQAKSAELTSKAAIYRVQSDIAKSNVNFLNSEADIMETTQSLAFAKSALAETRIRKAQDLMEGANRADAAARNLDPSTGSPALITMRNAMQFQSDIDMVRAQGSTEAADVLMKVANIRQQGVGAQGQVFTAGISDASATEAASNVQTAALIGAGTTLLSGAVAMKQPGLFGGRTTV